MRRLAALLVALWLGRWLARQLASLAGSHLLPPGPPTLDPDA